MLSISWPCGGEIIELHFMLYLENKQFIHTFDLLENTAAPAVTDQRMLSLYKITKLHI